MKAIYFRRRTFLGCSYFCLSLTLRGTHLAPFLQLLFSSSTFLSCSLKMTRATFWASLCCWLKRTLTALRCSTMLHAKAQWPKFRFFSQSFRTRVARFVCLRFFWAFSTTCFENFATCFDLHPVDCEPDFRGTGIGLKLTSVFTPSVAFWYVRLSPVWALRSKVSHAS